MAPVQIHDSYLTASAPTNTGREGVDWISRNTSNYEISKDRLIDLCQQAEEMDYNFALSMQGLRGTNLSAVWVCTDPDYDVTDRSIVMAQFVKMYMEKFYSLVSVDGPTDVEEIVHEALRLHGDFCKGWVTNHHKTLSAEVTAMSEALVGMFYDALRQTFPRGTTITRPQLARYLRRHPGYSGEFAHCLYHYMTSMEQVRGNRNPSYKAMNSERLIHMNALKSMTTLLTKNLDTIRKELGSIDTNILFFDRLFVDWHYIAGQVPHNHTEFSGYTNNFNLYRTRAGGTWGCMTCRTRL